MEQLADTKLKSTATKQAVNGRDGNGRFAAGNTPSTGFHTNPERRKNGKWDKDESISYWYNKLLRMPNEEFDIFEPANRINVLLMLVSLLLAELTNTHYEPPRRLQTAPKDGHSKVLI